MSKSEDTARSVLIVSASEQFTAAVKKMVKGVIMLDSKKSAAAARRTILERYYDLVIINAPLPDEPGENLAIDVTRECKASVLLVTSGEVYEDVLEHVTDFGILVISKPLTFRRLDQAIRFLSAVQNTIRGLEKEIQSAHEKMEELRIISKAKLVLIEQMHMTEDEAHRYIGKQAMDNGISRRRAAERILDYYE
ncbi:MAG: ANTAR domain-containing protein [Lachnospiraceae bacterium]|nr:ANTAR domain-containing protein [Lachnospiraceae bacterium]